MIRSEHMTIQWFPGHMAKARRQIEEKLKLIDLVIELLDARAPLSSQNPMINDIIQQKPKIVILMKSDLADHEETKKWLTYFQQQDVQAIAINVNNANHIQQAIELIHTYGEATRQRYAAKGIQSRPVRATVLGIPNVGKSSFINRVAKRKVADTGDRPGVTRYQQWIKVNQSVQLLDTPGILWPKFEDQLVAKRLAAIGTIKDNLLSIEDIAAFVLEFLRNHYPALLTERYGLEQEMEDMWEIFDHIGRKRGALMSGGKVDFEKVANIVLRDLRTGRLGNITLETVQDI